MENTDRLKALAPLTPEPPAPALPDAALALLLVLLSYAGRLVLSMGIHLFFPGELSHAAFYAFSIIQEILLMGLPAWLYYRRVHPETRGVIRRRRLTVTAVVSLSVAAVLTTLLMMLVNINWLALLMKLKVPLTEANVPSPRSLLELLPALLAVALLPGVCEEALFRGLLLPALERRGTGRALLFSGLLFGLMHGQYMGLPVHLLLGFLLGYIMLCFDSLWAAMLFHAVYNGATILTSYYMTTHMDLNASVQMTASMVLTPLAVLVQTLLPILLLTTVIMALLFSAGKQLRRPDTSPFFRPATQQRWPAVIAVLIAVLITLFIGTYLSSLAAAMTSGGSL